MTAATLRNYTCKDLAQMARQHGVNGWHGMRKDELIAAIVRAGKKRTSKRDAGKSRVAAPSRRAETKTRTGSRDSGLKRRETSQRSAPAKAKTRRTPSRLAGMHRRLADSKNLGSEAVGQERDRLVVMVRDPYWLHAYWELTQQSVDRARSALGQHWHTARPVLCLHRLANDGGATLDKVIDIHGGVNNWYIDVKEPPNSFRLEIGYLPTSAPFFCLARSNTVKTPAPGAAELIDENWTDVAANADQIFAMSGGYSADGASVELQELLEERLRRRLGRPSETRFGNGAATETKGAELKLGVDAELVVFGTTDRNSHVTIQGEPVQVQLDGTFAVKMHLPDRRQVIPIVAGSADGVEQKTVILGVERNTKLLENRATDR